MKKKFYYKSPIGILEIITQDKYIIGLKIAECENKIYLSSEFKAITNQLDEYFAGKRTQFDLAVRLYGSEFKKRVWTELMKIPYGKTVSYQEIAKAINKPKAQRAVGLACSKNPILLIIPCHRVISKSGALTGFVAGLNVKQDLLNFENLMQNEKM